MITEPGKITDRITFLGRFESCLYLVDGGTECVLMGGGLAYTVPDVLKQLEEMGTEVKKIKKLFILHAHYDHCGVIPYFKRIWPWAEVIASERAKKVFSDQNISHVLADLNRKATAGVGLTEQAEKDGFEFTQITVDKVIKGGDIIPCGDLTLEVIDAPGHSSCSIAIYIPQEKALFTSDSAGICFDGHMHPTANSNYDHYQQTLLKLSKYNVDVVLPEHFGVAAGEEGRSYILRAIEAAKRERAMLEESYKRTRDIAKSTEEITDILVRETPAPFIPREVRATVVSQMLKFLASKL
ncbi:putative Metallo-beta-lactamase domain protein [uncultured Desulfobacterium sp.]|uniref:Putative Metallo-beta-lactamase domain protein n=1 Tax=uncultured Desulfobacterium sp. TaxID=201089 RepID=A0A445MTP7_9BACT|nr:putative Metallo-beta-lactamase domain protein [uncultured Desulfobacterium sp.]